MQYEKHRLFPGDKENLQHLWATDRKAGGGIRYVLDLCGGRARSAEWNVTYLKEKPDKHRRIFDRLEGFHFGLRSALDRGPGWRKREDQNLGEEFYQGLLAGQRAYARWCVRAGQVCREYLERG